VFALAGAPCGCSPLLPLWGAFHSPEAPLTEIAQNTQRRFLGSSDGPYSAVEQPH
jgi:hypothetical protein